MYSGRSVNIAGMGHAHLQFGEVNKNFSHRIDGLTFGDRVHGMMYALDGEHKIAPISEYSFQYYVKVILTHFYINRSNLFSKWCPSVTFNIHYTSQTLAYGY